MRSLIALITGLAIAVTLSACQKPGASAVTADDMSLGNPSAKVTVIEYASVSCPFCAKWYNETFPAFKTKYIDTGKIHYVAREALTGEPPGLAAAGFLTARCAGKDKYFQVIDALYHQQEAAQSGQARAVLLNIARSVGMTDAQFDACINDEKALNALSDRWDHYVKDNGINSTPTFVINGKVFDKGGMTLAEMDAAIAEAEAAKKTGS